MPYLPSAVDTARYVGEPVAVVVATDRYVAEDAAELVTVDYEPRDVVVDTRRALEPDAPLLHPDAGTNVATDRMFSFGGVDAAFARAAHTVRGEYTFPRYSSVPMECYGVVARWSEDAEGPAVEAWANFHGPSRWCPSRPARSACRRAGSACTSPRTSAAASASSPASIPTSSSWPWPRSTRAVRCAGPRTGSSTCWRVRPAPDG